MERLIDLLKDGKSRSLEMLAEELGISIEHLKRDLEYLERAGVIKRVELNVGGGSCSGCSGCDGGSGCKGCMPDGGFQNMGSMWEIVSLNNTGGNTNNND